MSTKALPMAPAAHTAGIYADMTVDGPVIGTLVLIVDRAKNLPNRKTMGKQNPYCAARLGKEARKTDTDLRGGQTPRWDQELRFTVHDSPDYNNIKLSVFSEDKRTELIGEAWISLADIVKAGGGKGDLWQALNCKGKYAGELRLELTYYDSRPRPERVAMESVEGSVRVKRRPLPTNPVGAPWGSDAVQPSAMPVRANGPRAFQTPPRAHSMPPESTGIAPPPGHAMPAGHAQTYGYSNAHGSSPILSRHHATSGQYMTDDISYDEPQSYEVSAYNGHQPADFLPELPPSSRQRSRDPSRTAQPQVNHLRSQGQFGLPHSHSAPSVPLLASHGYDSSPQLRTEFPDPVPDVDFQHRQISSRPWRSDVGPARDDQRYYLDQDASLAPPPPPMHSISAPAVPHYAHYEPVSPPSAHGRHSSVPNSSPLQSLERSYGQGQRTPPRYGPMRGRSMDEYSSPEQQHERGHASPVAQTPPQYSSSQAMIKAMPGRHSLGGESLHAATPPRPHPLSQQLPRPRSPLPDYVQELPGSSPFAASRSVGHDPRGRDAAPLIKPRAISPRPSSRNGTPGSSAKPKSSFSIQFPVRAFESSEGNPLSTSRTSQTSPTRTASPGGIPFSPDSFDIHNPNSASSRAKLQGTSASPHTPYQIQTGHDSQARETPSGPIVGWHGQEIDPSDHLPVDSWAPEPEKKTPTKTYGMGRDRDFGPRTGEPSARQLSKDTLVNYRGKSAASPAPNSPASPSSPAAYHSPIVPEPQGRNRLHKKGVPSSPIAEPLREHRNYNDYSPAYQGHPSYSSAHNSPVYGGGHDALAREISNIDIGAGAGSRRTGGVPAPVAFVPVRSHKDRRTFY